MIQRLERCLVLLVAAWGTANVTALYASPHGRQMWFVVAMILLGMACKIAIAVIFFIMIYNGKGGFKINPTTFPSEGISFSSCTSVTLKDMASSAEDILRSLSDEDTTKALMNSLRETVDVLVDGRMVTGQLTTQNLLGEGTFGSVYELSLSDVKTPICMKVNKKKHNDFDFLCEVNNLQRLSRVTGTPELVAVSVEPQAFIMTMHGRRTLKDWYESWNEKKPDGKHLASILQQISNILATVHTLQLCHNDIRGENIMVEVSDIEKKKRKYFKVTLIDFASMCNANSFPYGNISNTLVFRSHIDPELLSGETTCSEATDMYSMGHLLQTMMPYFSTGSWWVVIFKICLRAVGPCHQRPTFAQLEKEFSRSIRKKYF